MPCQTTAVDDHATAEAEQNQSVRIPAHKLILAARSPVLRAMLSSGMKESCADEMEITGYAVEVVRAFVRFLYTDSCDFSDLDKHSWQLLAMADKYNVPALRCVCETYLASVLDDSNALRTLVDAHSHGAKEIKQKAIQYIVTSGKFLLKESGVQQALGCDLAAEVMSALVDAVAAAEGAVKKYA
jgi:speckle-type POZ protein